jgi:hypothetical protein
MAVSELGGQKPKKDSYKFSLMSKMSFNGVTYRAVDVCVGLHSHEVVNTFPTNTPPYPLPTKLYFIKLKQG